MSLGKCNLGVSMCRSAEVPASLSSLLEDEFLMCKAEDLDNVLARNKKNEPNFVILEKFWKSYLNWER